MTETLAGRVVANEAAPTEDIDNNPLWPFANTIAAADHARSCEPRHLNNGEEPAIEGLQNIVELPEQAFKIALSGVRRAIDIAGGPFCFLTRRD